MESGQNFTVKETFNGFLVGHSGSVTSIVSGHSNADGKENNILVSGGRDKTLLIWKLNPDLERNQGETFGEPFISLTGHNHFISDLSLSTDNNFLLSSSWDNSLRLWSLKNGKCIQRFSSAQKEILSVTFANENRQIFSAGTDGKLSLWNIKGKHMLSSQQNNHNDWVARVRNSPSAKNKFYASAGWDGKVKIWTEFFKLTASFQAHQLPIYALAINANGLFLATGSKDQTVKLWKVGEFDEPYKEYKCDSTVNDVAFNPEFQWVAAATETSIRVWDVSGDSTNPIVIIHPVERSSKIQGKPKFTSIAWSSTGKFLFCGATDGHIRVHKIEVTETA